MKLIKLKDSLETIINLEQVSILRFKRIKESNPYFEIIVQFIDNDLWHVRYEDYESNLYEEDVKYLQSFTSER